MKHEFEPSIDPWELMVEHNQRIQRLEQQLQQLQLNVLNHKEKIEQLISAVNTNTQLQQVNQDTLTKVLDNHRNLSSLVADMAVKSTPSAQGQH